MRVNLLLLWMATSGPTAMAGERRPADGGSQNDSITPELA